MEGPNLTAEQKKELIKRFTEVAVEVTKIPSKFFAVTIRELPDENLGFAGETVVDIKKNLSK
jgi:4-oxalocrotonate tautomerase